MVLTFDEKETRFIKTLREHYRREYTNGGSDECFILWLEGRLKKIYGSDQDTED